MIDILDNEVHECAKPLDELHVDNKSMTTLKHIKTYQYLYIDMFAKTHPLKVVINSGTTGNMMRGLCVKTSQSAKQTLEKPKFWREGMHHATLRVSSSKNLTLRSHIERNNITTRSAGTLELSQFQGFITKSTRSPKSPSQLFGLEST